MNGHSAPSSIRSLLLLVLAFLTTLVVALFTASIASAAALPDPPKVPASSYDSHHDLSAPSSSTPEQGPARTHVRAVALTAVDHASHGALARPDAAGCNSRLGS